jgi:Xaa-Pro aminopeptidase
MSRFFPTWLFVALLLVAPTRADDHTDRIADLGARRRKVIEALGPDGVLILRSRKPAHFSNDVYYELREDNDLYYLTGLEQPGTVLVVCGRRQKSIGHVMLFTTTTRPPRAKGFTHSFGNPRPTRAEAAARAGLPEEAIRPPGELAELVSRALGVSGKGDRIKVKGTLHYDHLRARREGVSEDDPVQRIAMALRKQRAGRRHLKPGRRILHPLRAIKSPYEVACMRRAIRATEAGLRAAIQSMRPGWFEYEIEALIEYHYRRRGCAHMAFPSIVGTGRNACIPHYTLNRCRTRNGDLVLMDVGGDFDHYAADITRTVPVNGTFTPRQRALYEVVLKAQEAGIQAVRPGAPFQAVDQAARREIARGLKALGVIERSIEVSRLMIHGTSHTVGMDVHDVRVKTLAPGMVVTVEPGVYLPEESIGIRIEDDVLVTGQGREVLSDGVPKTVEEIEALMAGGRKNQGGLPGGHPSAPDPAPK